MRCVFALLSMLAGGVAMAQEDVDADAGRISLSVKPLLCIVDRASPSCDMRFVVAWQSTIEDYYCLFSRFATIPLRCWREALAGKYEERRTVDESFQYWLTSDGEDEPLAAVTVEVMTTETDDRRRRRRTRHVWDIL